MYCTIDTSRVEEVYKSKAQLGAIRKAIEEEIRIREGQEHWRCVAVTKDSRKHTEMKLNFKGLRKQQKRRW